VNNQRLGKCNEESLPFEIYSGDIVQFGVDVTENNRKSRIFICLVVILNDKFFLFFSYS